MNDFRSGIGAEIKNLLKSAFVNPCSTCFSISEQETPMNDFRFSSQCFKASEIDIQEHFYLNFGIKP